MQYCDGAAWQPMGPVPGAGGAGCTGPAGAAGNMIYNSDNMVMQYCDGANWIAMGGAPNVGPTTGLVGWWKLDETSGTAASDSSGNSETATLSGTATFAAGKINNALSILATTDKATVSTTTALDNLAAVSTSVWIKPTTMPSSGNLALFAAKGWWGAVSDTGYVKFLAVFNTSSVYCVSSAGKITAGSWAHIVTTWDGTLDSTGVHLYINGVEDEGNGCASGVGTRVSDAGTALTMAGNVGGGFTGLIDDARVYNRALSAPEVSNLYYATGGH
jgi:Concanavalin A-like lectin/glucanases superfamily